MVVDFESSLSVFLLLHLTLGERSKGVLQVAGRSSWRERVGWCLLLSHFPEHVDIFRLKKKSPIEGRQVAFFIYLKEQTFSVLLKKARILKFQRGRLKIKHPKHLRHPALTSASRGIIKLLVFHPVLNVGAPQISIWGCLFILHIFFFSTSSSFIVLNVIYVC